MLLIVLFSQGVRALDGIGTDLESMLAECKDKENLFTVILPVTPPAVGATLQRMGIAHYCQYIQNLIDMKLFIEKGKMSENLLSMTDKHTSENIREMYRFHSFMTSLEDPKDGKFRPESLSQMKNRRKAYGYFRGLGKRVSYRQKQERIEEEQARNQKLSELAQKRSILQSRNECITPEESGGKRTDYDKIYERDIRPAERKNVYHAYQSLALYQALETIGLYRISRSSPGIQQDFLIDLRVLTNVATLKANVITKRENKEEIKYQEFVMDYESKISRQFLEKYNKYWGAYVNDNASSSDDDIKYDPSNIPQMLITEQEFFSMGEDERKVLELRRSIQRLQRANQTSAGPNFGEKLAVFENLVKRYASSRQDEESAKAIAFTQESKYLKEPIFNIEDGSYISKAPKPCDAAIQKSNWDRGKMDLEAKKLEAEYKEIQAQAAFVKERRRSGRAASDAEFIRKQNAEIEAGNNTSQKNIFNNIQILNGAVNK